jgi:hypothetical protein
VVKHEVTDEERMQRESSLIATIRKQLPDFARMCASDVETGRHGHAISRQPPIWRTLFCASIRSGQQGSLLFGRYGMGG